MGHPHTLINSVLTRQMHRQNLFEIWEWWVRKRLPFNLWFLIGCRLEIMPTKLWAPSFINKTLHIWKTLDIRKSATQWKNLSVGLVALGWVQKNLLNLFISRTFRMITSLLQKRKIVVAMGVKTIPFEYQLLMSLEMCPSASTCACFTTLMVFFLVAWVHIPVGNSSLFLYSSTLLQKF